jgi:unsaturated rhamnogalacturonyl hydrolase
VSETKSNINVYRLDPLGKAGVWVVVFLNLLGAALRAGPTYFDTAYIKTTMVKVAEWQLQHQKGRDMRDAANGVFHTGIFSAYEATGNPDLLQAVVTMGEANQWKPGPKLMFPDHHAILSPYIDIYRLRPEPRIITPAKQFVDDYLKSSVNDTQNQLITWWLCDYVFMDSPVFIKLGKLLNRPELLAKNDQLWHECHDLLFDAEEGLFTVSPKNAIYEGFNGLDPGEREANGKRMFWACGNGWVLAGLALTLKELPADYKERPFYETLFKRLARRMVSFQQPDGVWRISLLDPEAYPPAESNASGLLTFALAYGVNAGLLPREEFEPVVKKAWTGLNAVCLQPDFRIGWSEGGTAKPIKNYQQSSYSEWAAGAFLLAGSEVLKGLPKPDSGERFLCAADTQVIEINRAGQVTDVLKLPGQDGVYEAWRLPDGGIAYAHRGGLMVFDANKKLVLEHAAKTTHKGAEANSCAVLDGGEGFALLDSGACEIRVVDRKGTVVSTTPLPDLTAEAIHFRYRTVREVPGEKAYWVAQNSRNALLKIEIKTGKVLQAIPLTSLVKTAKASHKGYAVVQAGDGCLFATTSTGLELLQVTADGKALSSRTAGELGLACRYFNGMQLLADGNLIVACSDFHLTSAAQGRDVLAEINPAGKVIWRITRAQLVNQVEGFVEPKNGMEELRVCNVHVYHPDRLRECLNVNR